MKRRADYCNECRFWFVLMGNSGTGECRRFPPAHAYEPQGRSGRVSPVTGAYFWCGEHSHRAVKRIASGQDRVADEAFDEEDPQ